MIDFTNTNGDINGNYSPKVKYPEQGTPKKVTRSSTKAGFCLGVFHVARKILYIFKPEEAIGTI